MTALQPGAKVITASALTSSHWTTGELARRKPGTEGVIEVVLAIPKEDSSCARCYDHGAYLVKHAAGLEAQYHGDELIPVRKRAGLEQPSDVEERLSKLEAQHSRSLDAMARELNGLETSLERCQDRLRVLEQQRDPYAGVHDDSSLIPEVPTPPPSDACREIERLQEQAHLQCAEIDQLRGEVAELRRRDDDWRRRCEGGSRLYRRVCQALHVDEDSIPVDELADLIMGRCQVYDYLADPLAYDEPDPDALIARLEQTTEAVRDLTRAPETVSLHDALEAARWKMEEYGCAESALRAELGGTAGLADLAKEAVIQIRGGTAGILLYRRLSDPEAYNETDLDKLAAAALIARTSQRKQAEVLSDLRDIFGADEAGFGLRELAVRAVLHAQPVERLLKTYNAVEIDGCRGGLVSLTAPLPPHTVARGIADMLAEVVALAEGERATDRHAAGCADVRCGDVRCGGCAPSTQSKR